MENNNNNNLYNILNSNNIFSQNNFFIDEIPDPSNFNNEEFNPYKLPKKITEKIIKILGSKSKDRFKYIISGTLPHFIIIELIILIQKYDTFFAYDFRGIDKSGNLINPKIKPNYEKILVEKLTSLSNHVEIDYKQIYPLEQNMRGKKYIGIDIICYLEYEVNNMAILYSLKKHKLNSKKEFIEFPIMLNPNTNKSEKIHSKYSK
jgi:hypothetical protein